MESLLKAVTALKSDLKMPATIREAGVSAVEFESAVQHMAEIAFDDQCMGANPSYTLVDDLARILREAYSGDSTAEPKNNGRASLCRKAGTRGNNGGR